MPMFNDDDTMEQHKIGGGSGFQFSATKISTLGATEYTLFGVAADKSGSLTGFGPEISACIKSVIESCQRSPRADNLMSRVLTFDHQVTEVHGFRPLANCHLANYDGIVSPGGGTALYDASVNLIDSVSAYGKTLIDQDYAANGIVVILTDGVDEHSTLRVGNVKEAFARAMQSESLESLVSILIGVNVKDPRVGSYLEKFKTDAGFTQYVETQDASPKTLAKLAGFISKSVSSQSQAVGSKGPSQTITF
jgi:hypothetical protein